LYSGGEKKVGLEDSMTLGPANSQTSYLPIEFDIPDDEKLARELITKRERLTATVLNVKEIGQYELVELLSAQQWFSTKAAGVTKQPRYGYRKVFDMVALNSGANIPVGLTSFRHNITGITTPLRIFGTAMVAGPKYLPLPYASATNANIEIYFDNLNVNINNNFGSALTMCYITFDYTKQ
jgi:hypothetical protein